MHFPGNGRLKHPDGDYRDWTQYVWNGNTNSANYFQMKNGKIELSSAGLYFVYAQVGHNKYIVYDIVFYLPVEPNL